MPEYLLHNISIILNTITCPCLISATGDYAAFWHLQKYKVFVIKEPLHVVAKRPRPLSVGQSMRESVSYFSLSVCGTLRVCNGFIYLVVSFSHFSTSIISPPFLPERIKYLWAVVYIFSSVLLLFCHYYEHFRCPEHIIVQYFAPDQSVSDRRCPGTFCQKADDRLLFTTGVYNQIPRMQ